MTITTPGPAPAKILTLFGTRPEVIKLAPVIRTLREAPQGFDTINVSSSQHTDLLYPLIRAFDLRLDYDLEVMQPSQTLSSLCARVLSALDPVLAERRPDFVIVQGDTTTALAGATAAFYRKIPVAHVEAGLRSGNPASPFPEEMNRRLISRLATLHFAATSNNRDVLLREGVNAENIIVTGNPVVDALQQIAARAEITPETAAMLEATRGKRRILLTTHRRESFGETMSRNLAVLRDFVAAHHDTALIFPVHPNPNVSGPAREALGGLDRIHLAPPMDYGQFLAVMSRSWLIVSDSGGVQEEAPSLGKPLLILRENTERPEAVESGCARLAPTAEKLAEMLEEARSPTSWAGRVGKIRNPFGDGNASGRIVSAIAEALGVGSSPASPGAGRAIAAS